MSDESNKLVRQSHEIAPAEDFARKIEERLRAEPEPTREQERECIYAFKFERDVITRCRKRGPHDEHQSDGLVGVATWRELCQSVSPDGEPCIYQLEHVGKHGNGRDATWEPQEIAPVELPDFSALGEVLRRSPSFQQAIARRETRPDYTRQQPLRPTRDWQVPFGPAEIQPQSSITLVQQLQMYFRGEKLINTGDVDGLYIDQVMVGNRLQMPNTGSGISVIRFRSNPLDSGVRYDTAAPGINISMVVRNVSNEVRTFAATMFGKAVM